MCGATCAYVDFGSKSTVWSAQKRASARAAGCFPNISKTKLKKAAVPAKKKDKERRKNEEKEKREKSRQAKKEQKQAPPEIPRNSKNHSEVLKGFINVL